MSNKLLLVEKIMNSYLVGDFDEVTEFEKIKATAFARSMAESISDAIEEYFDARLAEFSAETP